MILNKGCSSLRRHGSTSPCVRTRSPRSITWLVPPAANPFRPVSPVMLAICSARQHYVIFDHRESRTAHTHWLPTSRPPLSMSYKNVGVICSELKRRGRGATDFCCTKDNQLDGGIEDNGSLFTLIRVENFAL
ncbi:hypothetical protein T09_1070 [Trichinella sp. T9]|nr:hypothetical protein T09_1070 [Trichinella sp. T9]